MKPTSLYRTLLFTILLCSHSFSFAQSDVFKKRVCRTINMTDSIIHNNLKPLPDADDSTLIHYIEKAVMNGDVAAYTIEGALFSKKHTLEYIQARPFYGYDTPVSYDPPHGEVMMPRKRKFPYEHVHEYRIVEDWIYNPNNGKTNMQILGIAPVLDVYSYDGIYERKETLYWLKYEDIRNIIAHYEQYRPRNTFAGRLWESYFESNVKPSEMK